MRLTVKNTLASLAVAASLCQTPALASGADDASKYVEKIGTQALSTITNTSFSKSQKQSRLDKMFADNVDIAWVARFVMGRYWRQATDAQKNKYLKAYQTFLIKHYTSRFTDYTSGSFTITGVREDGESEYTVGMELVGEKKNEPPVLVDYRVRKEGGGFKIFDIIVEGVSLITTQRSEFASVISDHSIDYLIAQLEKKSLPDSLSGATAAR